MTQNSTSCTGSPLPWWSSPAALAPRRCRCPQYHTAQPPCYCPPLCPPGPPSLAGPQSHCLGRSPLGISLCSDRYPGYLQKLKYHQYKQVQIGNRIIIYLVKSCIFAGVIFHGLKGFTAYLWGPYFLDQFSYRSNIITHWGGKFFCVAMESKTFEPPLTLMISIYMKILSTKNWCAWVRLRWHNMLRGLNGHGHF